MFELETQFGLVVSIDILEHTFDSSVLSRVSREEDGRTETPLMFVLSCQWSCLKEKEDAAFRTSWWSSTKTLHRRVAVVCSVGC